MLALLLGAPAAAATLSLDVEALVSFVDDPDGLLDGSGLTLGSTLSATYLFESETPDTDPATDHGEYAGAMRGVDVTLGAWVLSIDPAGASANRIGVGDDFLGNDFYIPELDSVLVTLDGAPIDYAFFGLALESSDPTILASDALPGLIPGTGPADFDVQNQIMIAAFSGASGFTLQATPTAATWVPEPSGSSLRVLGLLAVALCARIRSGASHPQRGRGPGR